MSSDDTTARYDPEAVRTRRADGGSDPRRIVADADVLAADLLVGGAPREAIDVVRRHSWLTLVASEKLLDDAEAVIGDLAADRLAADWRDRIEQLCESVEHPAEDHPALSSAYRGGAAHILSYDEQLSSARGGANLRAVMETSVRQPEAFVTVFDAGALYDAMEGGTYPGPDQDPRR